MCSKPALREAGTQSQAGKSDSTDCREWRGMLESSWSARTSGRTSAPNTSSSSSNESELNAGWQTLGATGINATPAEPRARRHPRRRDEAAVDRLATQEMLRAITALTERTEAIHRHQFSARPKFEYSGREEENPGL